MFNMVFFEDETTYYLWLDYLNGDLEEEEGAEYEAKEDFITDEDLPF